MAHDFSDTTQSGFLLSGDERLMLTDLKRTDPVTKNEIRRLQILRETNLIETTDLDELFQRYTHTIRRLFKVPIVALTLVDLDRVYIKARVGLEGDMQAPRRGSFCNRILMEDTPTVCATPDAALDPRFVHCLLNWPESFTVSAPSSDTRTCVQAKTVQGKFIHYYASVALVVDGVRVGSLCMFDSKPRPDLVEKALRLLPDFGSIISECMNRRHKLLLGSGSEMAELSMSVVYNLKFPIENLQKSFSNLGQCVAFQPSKRVTKTLLYEAGATTSTSVAAATVSTALVRGIDRIQEEGSHCSSSSSCSAQPHHQDNNAMLASPVSQPSVASRGAFSPESDDSHTSNDTNTIHTTTNSTADLRVPLQYKKIVNFDLLEPEKESLVDLLLEVRQRTRALIKLLAHSLSVAHDLQAQYHRQQDSAVSTSYTANNAYTSIAGKRPTDEACKERIYPVGKLNSRLKRMQNNITESSVSSHAPSFQVDPILCCTAADPEPVKFQFNGKTLSLVMYSTMYHLCKIFNSKMEVNVKFDERDFTPLHIQLANRVSSPSGNRKYIHGGMHRLCSPRSSKSSAKSTLDSGKVTRLPSFAMNNANFNVTLSGSSDGSISDAQQKEILLLHSRRSSLEESSLAHGELHTLQLLNNATTAVPHKFSAESSLSTANTPSDKLYPLPNTNTNANVFTSPRASIRKNSNSQHNQICGDIYITFKCPLPRANASNTNSGSDIDLSPHEVKADEEPSSVFVPEKVKFSPEARVETSIFENVILRNILSTAQGGFCSSTGSEYFPDPPNPVLSSLAVFANGGIRTSGMTDNNSMCSSLKMPRYEAISEVREDISEGEFYILTVRIPCNAYTTSSNGSISTNMTGSIDATATATASVEGGLSINKKVHALTPIQSLRNFGNSSSTAALSCDSESNQGSLRHMPMNYSSNSIDGSSPTKPLVPVLFGVQSSHTTPYLATADSNTATEKISAPKLKPMFNLFSPRSVISDEAHPDETAELPLRHKQDPTSQNRRVDSDGNSSAYEKRDVKVKPKQSGGGIGKSVSLFVQSVTHTLFGRGHTVSGGASVDGTLAGGSPTTSTRSAMSKRSMDVRVVPSPQTHHM